MKDKRRRILYIDHSLQKWQMVFLLALETTLTGVGIWMLHRALEGAMDAELYRVHITEAHSDVFAHLLREGLKVLGIMVLVNLLVLAIANTLWARRLRHMLRCLAGLMESSKKLDFSDAANVPCEHAVLVKALAWRYAEYFRLEGLRDSIGVLPSGLPDEDAGRQAAASELKKIREALQGGRAAG